MGISSFSLHSSPIVYLDPFAGAVIFVDILAFGDLRKMHKHGPGVADLHDVLLFC